MTVVAELPRIVEPQPSLSEHLVAIGRGTLVSQGTVSSTFSAPMRMTVPSQIFGARWFAPVVEQFQTALSRPAGWDSYDGAPTTVDSVEKALTFLGTVLPRDAVAPQVVAMSDGGLQLVWHTHALSVEATFSPSDDDEVYIHQTDDGADFEATAMDAVRDDRVRMLLLQLAD